MLSPFVAEKSKKSKKKSGCQKTAGLKGEGFAYFAASTEALRNSFRSFMSSRAALPGGLVTLHDLRFGVLREFGACSIDLFNKLFHD